jgi:hypothetical protein
MTLHKDYEISPFKDPALGNTPPVVQLKGAKYQGPPRGIATALAVAPGKPLAIQASVTDDMVVDPRRPADAQKLTVSWSRFRGPGVVHFSAPRSATSTAAFDTPGEYVVRLQANDVSGEGGGGFQCCWTSVLIKVTVGN